MSNQKRIASLSIQFNKKRFYKDHITIALENNLFERAFWLYFGLLELKISNKETKEVFLALKDIVRKVPQDQLARCLYELAVRLVKQDEFDEAEKLLKEAREALESDDQHLRENIEKALNETDYMCKSSEGFFDDCKEDELWVKF
jgi:tetratricopeptide repeat domain protein